VSGYLWGVATGLTVMLLAYLFTQFWRDNPIRRYAQAKHADEDYRLLLWEIRVRSTID
jgi:HAMP domain-containing protein